MPLNNPKFISTLASSITGTSGTNDDDRLKDGSDTLNANLINTLNIASAGSFVASGGDITITAGTTYSAYALTEIKYFRDGKYKTLAAVSAQEPTWAKNTANDWFGLIVIAANDSIAFRGDTTLGNTIIDGALPLEGDIPIAAVQISKSLANNATNRKVQFLGMNKLNSEFTAIDNGNVRLTINKTGTLTHRPSSTDYTITLPSATGTLALSGANVDYSQLIGTQPNMDADKITSGTIPDARIASASTWNAKQDALTFGKANTNALKLEETVTTNDILQAGTNQVKGLTYAQLKSALAIGLTDVSGDLDDIADGSNHKKIPNADATKISNLTVSGAIDLDAMKVKSDRLTVTGAIDVDAINTKVAGIAAGATVGATSSQISDIAANTAKTGITSSQASAITANTAKTGITTSQANAITANTAKVGITTTQADAITANSAKVGITTTQASDITAAKTRTDTLTDAYIETKAANKIDALLGADANAIDTLAQLEDYLLDSSVSGGIIQSLAGKVPTTTTVNGHALSSNITITKANVGLGNVTDGATVGATTAQADAIALNTAKTGITSTQANAITANTAKVGITTTQANAIAANTSKVGITSTQADNITANNAKVGITTTQADAITANTSKVGITTSQANAITANTAKTGITSSQASEITANTAKTGITSSQANAITANTAKPKIFYGNTAPTSLAVGDLWHKTDDDNLIYRANAVGANSIVTTGDGWYVHLSPTNKLKSAVTINGVSFDGATNVTVAAAAGTLTGNTLASGITSSSLTSVGTIATGTWNATAIAKNKVSTSGTWADADIAETSITQHEAALSIGNTQLSDATNLGKALLGATNLGNSETKFLKIATDVNGNHTITSRTDTQIRSDIGAGTSNLTVGSGAGDALAGNTSIPADLTVSGAGTVHANNYTNTTYSVMGASSSYAAGLVPAGGANTSSNTNKFLRVDGTWTVPPSESGGITSLAADDTPQLGGDLDVNGNKIKAIGSADLVFEKAQGSFLFKDTDSANASVTIGPSSMKFDFQTEGGTATGVSSHGDAVLQYVDSGGTARNFMTVSSNTVALENRAANGEVHIYGNTSTAGSGGRTLVAEFKDTEVTTQKKIIVKAQGEGISFADSDESHFVTLKPHATTTSNYDIKLPAAQGGVNTILKNDGSGNLSWAADNDTTYANLAALDSTANTKLSGIAANANNYTHPTYSTDNIDTANAEVIDTIETNSTGHITAMTKRTMTLANLGYTGATDANNYSHPTGAGNNHIPTGGASGQFLKYSSSGTAVWATPSYTTSLAYSAITGKPSTFAPTIGNTSTTAMAGDTTTITSDQATAIANNSNKVSNVTTNLGVTTTSTTITVTSSDGNNATLPVATDSAGGVMSAAMFSKLSGVEASADVTDTANVKNALGAAMPSNTLEIGDLNTAVSIPGNLTVTGTVTTNNVETVSTSNGVVFEGAASDGVDMILKSLVAGISKTINLPNAAGTVAVSASGGVALSATGDITANLSASHIPNLDTAKITSGSFATARIPNLAASKITSGTLGEDRIPSLPTSKITSGTFATARIADDAITTAKIADAQITNAKISTGIDLSKGGDRSLTAAKLKSTNNSGGGLTSDEDNYLVSYDHSTNGFTFVDASSAGSANQNAFSTIAVSGQSSVVANTETDILTLVAGSNVTLTTNATNDTVTIASTDTNTTYSVGDGGLTQNNFTNTLKNKLDGIAASANNYSLPTAASNTLGGIKVGTNLSIDVNGVLSSTDTNTTYSVGDGGLTQNNFTNTLKSKLDGIAASANNYSLPTAASGTLGGVKVGTNLSIDGNGVLSSTNTNQLTTFDIHDGDGTQVTMSHNRELKFVEGAGIDINFTDETPGSNEDPFDLTFKVANNGIGADQLAVTGNGTSGYVLTSDGDGTFSWSAKTTNTNTTYSAGTGLTLSSTTFSHTAHTGEVTGATALTIANNVVDEANLKISNTGSNGQFLSKQSGNTGGLTWATPTDTNTFRTITAGGNTLGASETLAFTAGSNVTITELDGAVTIAATDTNTDTNTQNVFTSSFVDSTDDILLRLTKSGASSGTQDIKFVAGSNITLTHTDANNITIASTDTNTNTTYSAGTNISLSGTTFNVDDAFLKNNANDTTTGVITAGGFTTTGSITLGGHTFNDIDIGTELVDSDNHIMSSGAIKAYVDANAGGGSVGGSDTQLLYNDGGTENGIASLTWTDTAGSEQFRITDTSDKALVLIEQLGTGNAFEIHDSANDTSIFKVRSSGAIGIGLPSGTGFGYGKVYVQGIVRADEFGAATGSASGPTHTFEGDQDTGMYSGGSASDILGFSTGGTERMRISASGFVTHANGSDHTFLIVGEEGDLYAGTGSTGNANGYQFSYGNGRANVTNASNGTDFGINVPHDCTLERIDVVFGNSGNVSSGTTTFVVVKNGTNQTGNLSTNHSSGVHDTHHTGLSHSFSAGDRFNLRTTTSSRQVGPMRMTARFKRTA